MAQDIDGLVAEAVAGAEGSLGRLLTMLEADEVSAAQLLEKVPSERGRAFRIGITGSPGSGKSTLIAALISAARREGLCVGVICVDPTSPVTGGAVLGDRIRMEKHYSDTGVFIRSMASRGSWGGIAKAVGGAVELLEACGKEVVIVETVGIGQEGIEVTKLVDVTVLVLAPGWGDSMQLMKAGILEVADIVAVNKADLGADSLVDGIRQILALGRREHGPVVVETEALNGVGVDVLWSELAKAGRECDRVGGRVEQRGVIEDA